MRELEIATARLLLTAPRLDQAAAMLDFVTRNREHLKPWSPATPPNFYTLAHLQEMVGKHTDAFENGSAVRFWISSNDDLGRIIGSIGFSQISRGPFCSCVLGYQIDRECEGKGLMNEALRAAMQYLFEEQKMHRIAANYQPANVRSGRLLTKLGFRIEGFAKDYLFIDGAWCDHILTSRVNDQFSGDISMAGWKNENPLNASAPTAK